MGADQRSQADLDNSSVVADLLFSGFTTSIDAGHLRGVKGADPGSLQRLSPQSRFL